MMLRQSRTEDCLVDGTEEAAQHHQVDGFMRVRFETSAIDVSLRFKTFFLLLL